MLNDSEDKIAAAILIRLRISGALDCENNQAHFFFVGGMLMHKQKVRIQLSEHFTCGKLLRFSIPSIVMMIFTSIYSIVDGIFVSNFAGDTAFAGLNLIFPVIMILGAVGMMFGAGGSAILARTLGEGDKERAGRYFSMFVVAVVCVAIVFGVLGSIFMDTFAHLLGKNATAETVEEAIVYGRVSLIGLPFCMLQYSFQSFFITAEKPTLGFFVTVIAGVVNAVLDAVFIICFSWGLAGAAAATVIGQVVGGIVPIIYFLRKNDSLLQLLRPVFSFRVLVSACTNGSSELLTNISSSVVAILYNSILLSVAGDDGVIAYGVIMYMNTVFMGIFYGFAMGISPIIGFHYGAKNQDELKGLFRRGLFILTVMGVILFGLAEALSVPFAAAFTSSDVARELTQYGIWIYSIAYILMGITYTVPRSLLHSAQAVHRHLFLFCERFCFNAEPYCCFLLLAELQVFGRQLFWQKGCR